MDEKTPQDLDHIDDDDEEVLSDSDSTDAVIARAVAHQEGGGDDDDDLEDDVEAEVLVSARDMVRPFHDAEPGVKPLPAKDPRWTCVLCNRVNTDPQAETCGLCGVTRARAEQYASSINKPGGSGGSSGGGSNGGTSVMGGGVRMVGRSRVGSAARPASRSGLSQPRVKPAWKNVDEEPTGLVKVTVTFDGRSRSFLEPPDKMIGTLLSEIPIPQALADSSGTRPKKPLAFYADPDKSISLNDARLPLRSFGRSVQLYLGFKAADVW
eukprot:TRINITY_DN11602_c0_g2_i2.p1 TRINITY_DN11602_c0_g2~~TRINITY_DN11602_c0_g2_i2.p1  ORF type:complete len:292 (+),score=31.49 TRINITY_DN11602_c0_g2_i2:78-878(+)